MFTGSKRNETPRAEGQGIKFNQVFTGEAFVTPLIFNPTQEQLKIAKNITSDKEFDEIRYTGEVTNNQGEVRKFRKVHLHFAFNPQENFNKDNKEAYKDLKLADLYYGRIELSLTSSFIFNKDKNKIYCIDNKLNGGWLVVDEAEVAQFEKLAVELKAAKKDGDVDSVKAKINKLTNKALKASMGTTLKFTAEKFDSKTVRPAREGEEPLMHLIFNMSNMTRATSPDGQYADQDKKTTMNYEDKDGNIVKGTKYDYKKAEYAKFNFDIESIFDYFVAGDYDSVNQIVFGNSEWSEYFKGNKLGVFLGARRTEDGKIYQSTYQPGLSNRGDSYFFRNDRKATIIDGYSRFGMTRMTKNMVKNLAGEYGYKEQYQESFEFKPLDESVFEQPEPKKSDDLPF